MSDLNLIKEITACSSSSTYSAWLNLGKPVLTCYIQTAGNDEKCIPYRWSSKQGKMICFMNCPSISIHFQPSTKSQWHTKADNYFLVLYKRTSWFNSNLLFLILWFGIIIFFTQHCQFPLLCLQAVQIWLVLMPCGERKASTIGYISAASG